MKNVSLGRVCALLAGSGACALVYQIAWFRQLRLIFGASTASSAAVLCMFMGGLGLGGAFFGARVDRSKNPLLMYAHLELVVAVTAGITPLLVWGAEEVYLAIGGATTLGDVGGTVLRLLLTVLVLGPTTFAMGGTLPSAARAVETAHDAGRRHLAALYGVNTFGAVVGAVAANFLLLEVFGTRLTLWLACLVNALVAMVARMTARTATFADVPEVLPTPPAIPVTLAWFPPVAAAVTGFAFMLMELVWYRMLSPILGGSSYTFGLILAVALAGIGLGGLLYSRMRGLPTLLLFAGTCAVEAVAIVVPYALGDRLAIFALLLRAVARVSFSWSVISWSLVTVLCVLPAAIVAGFQFPAIIGLYGRGREGIGRDVGRAYLANTLGAIVGSLAGGFGLLPLLTAPRCWTAVVLLLALTAGLAVVLDLRISARDLLRSTITTAFAVVAILLTFATGPTAVWRHSGIGAGRADSILGTSGSNALETFTRQWAGAIRWEAEGRESSVALEERGGYAFVVNGKIDGHAISDGGTQVMSGLVATLFHPDPRTSLVIGLGTGSTAGWLGQVPSMERVDVVELEPAILRVARDCAVVNQDVLANPKVHVRIGDAREVLRTTRERYDIVFSEPSNPYRAGISSLYTREYYRAIRDRLNEGGFFVQWLQAYEVDGWVVSSVMTTLKSVFTSAVVWETDDGDLVLVSSVEPEGAIDVPRLRARMTTEPYASAAAAVWKTRSAEGILAHYLASSALVSLVVDNGLGVVNEDDHNVLEFAFARGIGHGRRLDQDLEQLAKRTGLDRPRLSAAIDPTVFDEEMFFRYRRERRAFRVTDGPAKEAVAVIEPLAKKPGPEAMARWRTLGRKPTTMGEASLLGTVAVALGSPEAEDLVEHGQSGATRDIGRAGLAALRHDTAAALGHLEKAFVELRSDPWVAADDVKTALSFTILATHDDPSAASHFIALLREPFAVNNMRDERLASIVDLARNAHEPRACVDALDHFVVGLWSEKLLTARVACFAETKDPRLGAAERDLDAYVVANGAFGAGLGKMNVAAERPAPAASAAPTLAPEQGGMAGQAAP